MRFRHIFSETFAGLRQNLTMTLAVVMTMWVSLSLFGAGLLANQQVDLFKGDWYDKIEISVFLCTPDVGGEQCEPGQGVTEAQKDTIRQTLESNPEVAPGGVYFETKQEAWEAFQKAYEGSPIQDSLTVEQMQESFRVKLKNPEQYEGVVSSVVGLKGVQSRPGPQEVPRPVLLLAEPAAVGDHRGLRAVAVGGRAADRQHHPAGSIRPTTRDRHHAPGRSEQSLYHASVPF